VRILQQCIYFPPEVGGLESHAYYLCRELVRQGHHVTMVTSRRSRPAGARDDGRRGSGAEVVPAKRTPAGWAAHTLATVPHFCGWRGTPTSCTRRRSRPRCPACARREVRLPLVITLHTSHFLKLAQKPAWRPVLRRIVRSADWLLAASEEIRDVALELYPHPRAEALTNGVDTELFAPRGGARTRARRRRA
jgi:glycosyltransferase involved in cell wall biosynthesis